MVTEGAASNAWIVSDNGTIVTRYLDHSILRGITRTTLIEIIAAQDLKLVERKFSLDEALAAREAFITGATAHDDLFDQTAQERLAIVPAGRPIVP